MRWWKTEKKAVEDDLAKAYGIIEQGVSDVLSSVEHTIADDVAAADASLKAWVDKLRAHEQALEAQIASETKVLADVKAALARIVPAACPNRTQQSQDAHQEPQAGNASQ